VSEQGFPVYKHWIKKNFTGNPDACGDVEFAFSYFGVSSHIGVSCSFTKARRMKTPLRSHFLIIDSKPTNTGIPVLPKPYLKISTAIFGNRQFESATPTSYHARNYHLKPSII